ncbi:bacteriocin [Rodentibacter caecimuris]|uniref:KilA-N domain-containing protein n=1 Tax=Rodentibacter caecimuris TaxID=1796644 RepID=UPI00109499F3|nr:KilA-N domain-containing protein [Pasteurella caecimuris]MCR1838548.1 KilA-N domain-containing protein [Pasteurella caecimuris]MCU0107859.1 KilA-N domain-containing protein [Pasteurella caecimuris]TGY50884.1 bacteriocin [Pasteurella caecimuris]
MTNLTILSNKIRTLDNLYSLNDLHLASGNDPKHRPSLFARNEQTKELAKEIESERSTKTIFAIKTIRGGKDISVQGTWACEELVLSYAMWISPKFHLIVLRAFLAMHRNEPKQLALPTPERTFTLKLTEQELCDLCWLWKAAEAMRNLLKLIEPALDILGSRYAGAAHSCSVEYRRTIESARDILLRPTGEIKEQGTYLEENWHRVLHELRKGELNKIY